MFFGPQWRAGIQNHGRALLRQRVLLVAGMAFFWPFIKGPYIARFLDGAGQGVPQTLGALAMCAAFALLSCGWMRTAARLVAQERAGGKVTNGERPHGMQARLRGRTADAALSADAPAGVKGTAPHARSCVQALVLSYLLSFAVELPADLLPEPASTALAALLPLLSALALWALMQLDPPHSLERAPGNAPMEQPGQALWPLVGLVVLAYAASGVLSGMYSATPVQGSLLSAALALPLVACAFLTRGRTVFSALLWGLALVPLIMSALFVIVPASAVFSMGLSMLTAGRRGVFMLLWLLLVECCLARGDGRPATALAGAGYAAVYLLVRTLIASLRAGELEHAMPAEALQGATLAVALVIVACSLGVIALVARRGPGGGEATPAAAQPAPAAPTEHELRHAACQAIAQEAQLTEKEGLALEYVSMGYTVARIAQERGVSENTVRTHTKGLYRKLDVHSKQEVIELVERHMGK